jgi:hypothetical protein
MSKAAVSVIGTLLVLGFAGCTKSQAEPNDVFPDSQQGGIVEAYGLKIRLPFEERTGNNLGTVIP